MPCIIIVWVGGGGGGVGVFVFFVAFQLLYFLQYFDIFLAHLIVWY